MLTNSVRFACAICGEPTNDDPVYVELAMVIDNDGPEVQYAGAHAACLRSAFKSRDFYIADI